MKAVEPWRVLIDLIEPHHLKTCKKIVVILIRRPTYYGFISHCGIRSATRLWKRH